MTRTILGCCGLVVAGCIGLACLGFVYPADFLFQLFAGWALYCKRVLPQVRWNGAGVATAVVCLTALAAGTHLFLRWLYGQVASPEQAGKGRRAWPVRWTAILLGLVVLMFVAGISAVGVTHQTTWLVTSPEPLVEGGMRDIAARIHQSNDLKNLARAMHNFQEANGRMPAAASYDGEGRPLLSWRVLILPYIEQDDLFREFHLDEPWDSPHNLRLLPRMPKIYASPWPSQSPVGPVTAYRVFTGPGTAFEGTEGLSLKTDFPDGTATTFLIVEATEAVPWTKPEDLPYDPREPLPGLGGATRHHFQAATADGAVHRFEKKMAQESLRAWITRNGGEDVVSE